MWPRSYLKQRVRRGKNHQETYFFQGQSTISKHWFDIDLEWVEDNFMTREPDFSRVCLNSTMKANLKKIPIFPVTIGNAKETGEVKFHTLAPALEYKQKY